MGTIHLVYRVNNCVGFFLALLLNTLLLWLILKRSSEELRTYSIILVQTCLSDLLFALAIAVGVPVITVIDGGLVTFQAGWLAWIPLPTNFCLVSSTISIYIFSFSALGAQFLYRYLASVRGTKLTVRQYTAMLGAPLAVAALTMALQYISTYPSPELMRQTAEVLGPMLGVPCEGLIVPSIPAKTGSAGVAYACLFVTIFGTITGTYALIIWCIYQVSSLVEREEKVLRLVPYSELPLPARDQAAATHSLSPNLHPDDRARTPREADRPSPSHPGTGPTVH